ncbi:Uncharacterised protein [Kluyvera intermedia]|nr:Uncharacterised protein [Kluyvera intermedia]
MNAFSSKKKWFNMMAVTLNHDRVFLCDIYHFKF